MKKCFLFAFLAIFTSGRAQPHSASLTESKVAPQQPVIGKPIPYFELNDVNYYHKKSLTPHDFKGKWLVLDFFTSTCLACFASFPKINKLQEEFRETVHFVLVGDNEMKWGNKVKSIYEKISQKQQLNLTVAYDSVLFSKWAITAVPYVVIIDPNGVVKAINNSQDLNPENMRNLIERGNSSDFRNIDYTDFDETKPYLVEGNGGPDTAFLFRSLLSQWKRPTPFVGPASITAYNRIAPGFQTLGAAISYLYMAAFFDHCSWWIEDSTYGVIARTPIFIGIDSSSFIPDSKSGKNLYNYSLTVPKYKATIPYIMAVMQRDLKNYFGYNAVIKTQQMPYWKLTADSIARIRLRSRGKKFFNDRIQGSGVEFGNYPIKTLLMQIFSFHQLEPPFIDETGINENIDIKFDALMTDFNDIKRELTRHGLKLEKGTKEMKVLIISPG